jgi:hypothetical protein
VLAVIVEFTVLMVSVATIWLVDLPAVLQVFSLFLVLRWHTAGTMLKSSLSGEISYQQDGVLMPALHAKPLYIHSVSTLYAPLFLSIKCGSQRWLLWRDSCVEADYRYLIFNEKRRQYASDSRSIDH